MTLRKGIFWLHLACGVVAGIVVAVMSVTGVLLAYEKEMIAWVERDDRRVTSSAGPRLPVAEIVAGAGQGTKAAPASLTLFADPTLAAAVSLGRDGIVYVNPYTGAVTGREARGVRGFFRAVTDWHRWLAADTENRAVGRAITGACNLAFLGLIVTGPILWIPRIRSWRHFRPVTFFQRQLSGRARDFNWHNVIGVWTAVPLFVVVATAVVISYPWASNLVYRVAGEQPPPARGGGPPQGPQGERPPAPPVLSGLDPLWARAEEQVAGWESISLRFPPSLEAPVTFTIDRGDGGRPQLRSQLTLERATGAVTRYEPFESQSRGRRLRSWMRFLHTGEAAGLVGQTIAMIASAGAVVLVWTGLALSWRRLRAWLGRREQEKSAEGNAPILEEAL